MAICSPRFARAANGPCRAENNFIWAVNNHNAQQKHIIVILTEIYLNYIMMGPNKQQVVK